MIEKIINYLHMVKEAKGDIQTMTTFLLEIEEICKNNPNDHDLGYEVRKLLMKNLTN